jgi:hypothetical protein
MFGFEVLGHVDRDSPDGYFGFGKLLAACDGTINSLFKYEFVFPLRTFQR